MTTSAIIILSVLLGGSVCANVAASASKNRLAVRIEKLRAKIKDSDNERERHGVRYILFDNTGGCFSVYRVSYGLDGTPLYHTLIKKFDTDDAEYNFNEAKELVENLERTLCYD